MTTITLPKTPLVPLFMDHDCRQELDAMFRARDLEVARLVLEGAANLCKQNAERWVDYRACYVAHECAKAISILGVKHHE